MELLRNKIIRPYRGYVFKGVFIQMGKEINIKSGVFSSNTSTTDPTLSLGRRCLSEVGVGLQHESSNGFCSLWYRLDRDSCNNCCGCVFRKSLEEEA